MGWIKKEATQHYWEENENVNLQSILQCYESGIKQVMQL